VIPDRQQWSGHVGSSPCLGYAALRSIPFTNPPTYDFTSISSSFTVNVSSGSLSRTGGGSTVCSSGGACKGKRSDGMLSAPEAYFGC
jgi:hypothetical protein